MSREDGLYSNYADEVRDWAKKEIAKMAEEICKLKKENEGLQKEHDRMSAYMYPRAIKYCEKCMKYGDEDEIVQDEEDECSYICHDCCNSGDDEFKMFVKRYHEMAANFMGLNK